MTCEVRNKEINSQCAELLVRPLYIIQPIHYTLLTVYRCVWCTLNIVQCILYFKTAYLFIYTMHVQCACIRCSMHYAVQCTYGTVIS